tara:strand:+ start:1410 stop:2687 length:1278 start_codon:yes stop_codon:yes gene_type:complete
VGCDILDSKVLIEVSSLSKKFSKNLRKSLLFGLYDILKDLSGLSMSNKLRKTEFHALSDISFSLKKGEVLGIAGSNGSGKTTVLKIINGLLKPDGGTIKVNGKIGALISLGAGFSPILSGRENIYINGAVLGLSKIEVDSKIDEIIEFSGVGEFIDMPVQNYSSGMRVKLGFSIAINIKPEILLVDEVLAVGDYAFREKSFRKMTELCKKGVGVIFISHNISAMYTLCDRVLWLEKGKKIMIGDSGDVLREYIKSQNDRIILEKISLNKNKSQEKVSKTIIEDISIFNQDKSRFTDLKSSDDIIIQIDYKTTEDTRNPNFCIDVCRDGVTLFSADMLVDNYKVNDNHGIICCIFKELKLEPGLFDLSIMVYGETQIIKYMSDPIKTYFRIIESDKKNALALSRGTGMFKVKYNWFNDIRKNMVSK